MYKIIGGDNKEYGSISPDQLRTWIAEGRVNAQTLAQVEGSADWKPLALFPEFTAITGSHAQPYAEEILARDYSISTGSCINRGWELVKANFWLLVGGTFLVLLVMSSLGVVSHLGRIVGLILTGQILGQIAGLILSGPLMGGIYWMYLKTIRAQQPSVGDGFAGFSRGFLQLMLAYIVTAGLTFLAILPGIVLIIGAVVMSGIRSLRHIEQIGGITPLAIVLGVTGFLVCLITATYLGVCWIFSLALVVDRQMPFWDAMKLSMKTVRKHWWQVFWLLSVAGGVAFLGVFACCIGLFVTIPIAYASMMYAYEDIFSLKTR